MKQTNQTLILKPFTEQNKIWPTNGKHIMAQYDEDTILVYQAYRAEIANYAVEHQKFGGAFSFSRMSWIKPNFLWMMYRCGWASKEEQERVLAVRIKRIGFEKILSLAVHSSFNQGQYESEEEWRTLGENSDVRLQWDPDHDPFGKPLERRAIQLGLRGETLKLYSKDWIVKIEDITDFVTNCRKHLSNESIHNLDCPLERIYEPFEKEKLSRIFL